MNAISHEERVSLESIDSSEDLLNGIENGNKNITLKAIEAGANLNDTYKGGYPVLYLAVSRSFTAGGKKNGLAILKTLIEHGANLNKTSEVGRSALHLAAWKGAVSATLELVKNKEKLDLNLKDKWGNTPLHLIGGDLSVSDHQKREITSILMRAGADPLLVNEQNETAIDTAKSRGALLAAEAMESFVKLTHQTEQHAISPVKEISSNVSRGFQLKVG